MKLDISTVQMLRELGDSGRLELLNLSFDPTNTFTFWAVICAAIVGNLGSYLADQMALQRYLASASPREAARSFLINIVGALGIVVTLIGIGLLLWLWYRHYPDPQRPTEPDKIISYFISKELPMGVSGLLIAAILAATMSSMTSGINALAGALTNDWVARLGRPRTSEAMFRLGRRASLAIGLLATVSAGVVDQFDSIYEASHAIMGYFSARCSPV